MLKGFLVKNERTNKNNKNNKQMILLPDCSV